MTRDFSNQRRDGQRPPSRNSFSSGRYREEESFRPARPRLSRDTVDRGWENGAPRKYSDYRPRQNSSTPPTRRQGRPTSPSENFRSSQNRGSYSPRSEGYRFQSSSPAERRSSYGNSSETSSRPFSPPGHRAPAQSGLNSERWTREQGNSRPPSRNNNGSYRSERSSQGNFAGPGSQRTRFERNSRPYREQEYTTRERQGNNQQTRRDSYHPRWQSRPEAHSNYSAQNEYSSRRSYPGSEQNYSQPRSFQPPRQRSYQEDPGTEQFKGDYERFDTFERTRPPAKPVEKHVTPHPNGRVLKGSRPSQRRQAAFWNEVEAEAEMLHTSTHVEPAEPVEVKPEVSPPPRPTTPRPARPRKSPSEKTRTVRTVKTTHAENAESSPKTGKTRASKKKGPGNVTRPSQRGFKWPSAHEEA